MIYRVYVEKKHEVDNESRALLGEINGILGISSVTGVRVLNRYDVEHIEKALFESCVTTVFSEPQTDDVYFEQPAHDGVVFAVEYLPGQFDQRADSAAQCVQMIAQCERPTVRSARVYLLQGNMTAAEVETIKHHVINPVESREAALEVPATLDMEYTIPEAVETLEGFTELDEAGLQAKIADMGLAMDLADIRMVRDYFRSEGRQPTITEIRVLDTYWSDHCRHTTFNTIIDSVTFESAEIQKTWDAYINTRKELGRTKPICLMDLGTLAAKALKKSGQLTKLDESEEINACTVKMKVTVDGEEQDWLLLFKNETHNHPTEIEPFGGAATCIGGAIRDPLSGRSYVYAAMRVTGAADPTVPVSETIAGKLPQRTIVTKAAAGYSSYGNQIGLATGLVDEIYHPGYAAKRMEVGAVIAAAPAANVRREVPADGDVVILLGGRTGRDGCGGATGSSKAHTEESLSSCGAEVQKGNAPEERKLQRLFRNPEASRMIKRCNDFGAGGVSVAVGELAAGLNIDLNAVPRKYEGLDGTELAISESQERMAVVVAAEDAQRFAALADAENLESTLIARVTAEPRLVMRWNGQTIVDLSRAFLDTNGAEKHIDVAVAAPETYEAVKYDGFTAGMESLSADLNSCVKRGLVERFDSTIGTGTVMMPFGGKHQLTPSQCMVHRVSVEQGHTDDCSFMAWGYDPYISEKSPYHGAYLAVVESVSKMVAAGAKFEDVYLSFQEYFERLRTDAKRWGKPMAALLGAYRAQMELGIAAIGGKDSMSGSFEQLDVPPTLISFAVTTGKVDEVVSGEFKAAGRRVAWLRPELGEDGLPTAESLKACFDKVYACKKTAVYTPTRTGVADAVAKMCLGNGLGFAYADGICKDEIFAPAFGSFIIETEDEIGVTLGYTTDDGALTLGGEQVAMSKLLAISEGRLEDVYPTRAGKDYEVSNVSYTEGCKAAPAIKVAKPRVLIPVFPGTNCEYDTARAFRDAGAEPEIFVIRNLTAAAVSESVEAFAKKLQQANIVFLPGGFSGGDEPDGSGKFITAFFRNGAVADGVRDLLGNRDGLMGGICNGFQALIKLGLVPYGDIRDMDENCPTLTFNKIARHQSRIVRVRVASNLSPWLQEAEVGGVYNVPISHGEGRFLASDELVAQLAKNGQVATQYADLDGNATSDILFNPNGSVLAVEGITSPDGRVFGKMGHAERCVKGLYQNVPGNYDLGMFRSAVKYFK
ncbi:MAG: phosphoribosylformylglycinamidine synthase [Ruminococcaceae bacterium]|nr:phosphoribosylformylglycinamidine synthase [Oscillospiraceae bacterium]